MDMTVPAGMYGTWMSSVTGINYNNLVPGNTIAVDPMDVVAATALGFTPGAVDANAPEPAAEENDKSFSE